MILIQLIILESSNKKYWNNKKYCEKIDSAYNIASYYYVRVLCYFKLYCLSIFIFDLWKTRFSRLYILLLYEYLLSQ